MKKRALEERLATRNHQAKQSLMPHTHVRAELNRLARLVKKLNTYDDRPLPSRWIRQIDVLALIREAKR